MESTMSQVDGNAAVKEIQLETHLQIRLGSRVHQFRVVWRNEGVVLHGRARTYYAKQLAQHLVMALTKRPILANEIEVH
jgi:hypothetical protein